MAEDAIAVVNEQAEDGGLWFVPETITEDYLQRALRRLHAAVEGKSQQVSEGKSPTTRSSEEIEALRAQLREGSKLAEEAAKRAGVKLHPRLAALKDKPMTTPVNN